MFYINIIIIIFVHIFIVIQMIINITILIFIIFSINVASLWVGKVLVLQMGGRSNKFQRMYAECDRRHY